MNLTEEDYLNSRMRRLTSSIEDYQGHADFVDQIKYQ